MKRLLVPLEVWGEFLVLGWALPRALELVPAVSCSSRKPPHPCLQPGEENREGREQGRLCGSLELQIRCGMNFASRGGWEAAISPTCPGLLQGNTSALVPCQLCRLWHGISHRQQKESSALRALPQPVSPGRALSSWNQKRWTVLCRDEALKSPL